jgi:RNA polymerase sigma factor (sigma-70 family)
VWIRVGRRTEKIDISAEFLTTYDFADKISDVTVTSTTNEIPWETVAVELSARLRPLIRNQLGRDLSSRLDSADVLQSALGSLFRVTGPNPSSSGDWHRLWGLAAVIVSRKCQRQAERHRAARRDVRRDIAFIDHADESTPDPEAEVVAREILTELLSAFEPGERRMLMWHLEGYSSEEIAAQAGCSSRTVRRLLERARSRFANQGQTYD